MLTKETSALIEGFGYIATTAAQTEHFALARFATDRIDYLTSRLRGPKPEVAPDQAYLEAMAILHSSLATRAYALLRLYGEQFDKCGTTDNELLLQARKDESRVMEHFADRSTERRVKVKSDAGYVYKYIRFLPQANSGYASWDVRAMRYLMGYHFMNGTLDDMTTGSGTREFLEALTGEKIATTAASTAAVPLLGYLNDPKERMLRTRVLLTLPKSTRETLEHEAGQERATYKLLLRSRY